VKPILSRLSARQRHGAAFIKSCLSLRRARFALLEFGMRFVKITRVLMVGVGRDNVEITVINTYFAIYPLGDYSITLSG